ncbi:MAG: class I SAM-dependent methyltransferase [Limisphaerales bacterium]
MEPVSSRPNRVREPAAQERLHRELRSFYNAQPDYFEQASATNRKLTPERAQLFKWISPGDRVLDVGCGTCENGLHLATRGPYFGCDISFVALKLAAAALPPQSRGLVQAESQTLPFLSNTFDVVLSTYALEHFVFPRESLDEIWRVCRPGGRVMLISPAYDDPRLLPPSTSHWSRMQRRWQMVRQTGRQLMRHIRPRHFYFARIEQPRILSDAYQSDFDAVHLVSAREIANLFHAKGAAFLFERKRIPRPAGARLGSGQHRLREAMRNALLRLHLGEYAGLNLQLVVAKPGAR